MEKRHFYFTAALILLLTISGCAGVTPPEFDNPGDPLSPGYNVPVPGNLTASFHSYNSVLLKWLDTAPYKKGYAVERSVNNGPFEKLRELAPDVHSYLDSALDNKKSYAYRVYTFTDNAASEYSAVASLEPGNSVFMEILEEDNCTATAFSHNMNFLATAHWPGNAEIRLRNAPYSSYTTISAGLHKKIIKAMSFSPNDELLAFGGEDSSVYIWNLNLKALSYTITGIKGEINSLEFSPNGNLLAVASTDKDLLIFDTKTWGLIHTLSQHTGSVNSAVFNRDGTLLASGSNDGNLILWDMASWSPARKINAGGSVKSVAFSPEAMKIAAAAGTSYILWEASSGTKIVSLDTQGAAALSVAFSSDGTIFAGSCGGDISFYSLSFKPYSVSYYVGKPTKAYYYSGLTAAPTGGTFASSGYPVARWSQGGWQIIYK